VLPHQLTCGLVYCPIKSIPEKMGFIFLKLFNVGKLVQFCDGPVELDNSGRNQAKKQGSWFPERVSGWTSVPFCHNPDSASCEKR
jgi:hypothetical protein